MLKNNIIVSRRIAIFNSEMNNLQEKGILFCDINKLKTLKIERDKIKSVLRKHQLGKQGTELLASIKHKGYVDYNIILKRLK